MLAKVGHRPNNVYSREYTTIVFYMRIPLCSVIVRIVGAILHNGEFQEDASVKITGKRLFRDRQCIGKSALTNRSKYSQFTRLVRVIAYCGRFCRNNVQRARTKDIGPLTVAEIAEARNRLIKLCQAQEFGEEIRAITKNPKITVHGRLACLKPFLDTNGIMRVGGRLQKANIPYDNNHIIVTTGSPVTERQRKLFGQKATAASPKIQRLVDSGVIRPSSSPHMSKLYTSH
ncbi:hypothetical protein M0804_013962 [Polistes exclamans]|nr:hypothetical protein M0804_013962 [Polistes exclamans]